jgi:hypothetical protein
MKPFDLPPDSLNALRADIRRPAEVREHVPSITKADDREHVGAHPPHPPHVDPPPVPTLPAPTLPPRQFAISEAARY